jgi:energy-coupling factor transporter ATP-binding protein EcfA2
MNISDPENGKLPQSPEEIMPFPGLVQTEVFRRVRNAIEVGETPVLIVGVAGSGKTTLLKVLAEEWARSDRKVIFLSLDRADQGEDIIRLLRRHLAEYSALARDEDVAVIAGSSRSALRATINLIESAPPELLIVFDGLDGMAEQSQVIQLLESLPTSVRVKIVVSSRFQPAISSRIFRSVFQIPVFTEAEVAEFIRQSGGPALDEWAVDYITRTSQGLPLLISPLLNFVRREGFSSTLSATDSIQALVMRLVNRTLGDADPGTREEYFRALTSLAVLNRPIHASEYPASALLKMGSSGLLTLPTETGIFFAHASITEAVLSYAGLTTDSADYSLSSLKFGAEEAERDSLLSNSFILLPEFSDVLFGRKNIVIGDRGTGKSAMFSHLSMPIQSGAVGKVLIKPLTHPADMLRRLEANGSQLGNADQFRAGWLTLVAYCIADQVRSRPSMWCNFRV